jgi:hypothetical protein
LDVRQYKELRKYVGVLLNPLSHADVGVDRYKEEIRLVEKILRSIDTLHSTAQWKSLVNGGEKVRLKIPKPTTTDTFVIEYDLKSSLYYLTTPSATRLSSFKGKVTRCYLLANNSTISEDTPLNGNDTDMHKNYLDFCRHDKINVRTVTDWHKFLYNSNNVQLITLI